MVGIRFNIRTVLGFVALVALTIFASIQLRIIPNSSFASVTSFPFEDSHDAMVTMYAYDMPQRLRVAIMGVGSEFKSRVRVDPVWNGRMTVTIDGSLLTYSSEVTLVFLTDCGVLFRECSLEELSSFLIGDELFSYPEDVWQHLGPSDSSSKQPIPGEPSISADGNTTPM